MPSAIAAIAAIVAGVFDRLGPQQPPQQAIPRPEGAVVTTPAAVFDRLGPQPSAQRLLQPDEEQVTAEDGVLYTDLVREFKSYAFTAQVVQVIIRAGRFDRERQQQRWYREYEIKAILERWILNVAQEGAIHNLPTQMLDHEYGRNKFVAELQEVRKIKMTAAQAEAALAGVHRARDQVDADLQALADAKTPITLQWDTQDGMNMSLGRRAELHVHVPTTKRVAAILKRASKGKTVKEGLAHTARILLRYTAHLHTSAQHWGPIQPIFDHLLKHFGVRHEGFASPLNSRAILSDEDCTYCTLYGDTDGVAGSLGSFFNQDLLMDEHNWTVHPPFTETLLTSTAAKVLSSLQEAKDKGRQLILGVGWCDWTDMQCFKDLLASGFKRMHHSLPKNGYHFELPDGSLKVATFVNHYFLFSALDLTPEQAAQVPELGRLVQA